jgi:hypothetical protein
MTAIIDVLNEQGIGLLITVDEVSPDLPELKTLVVAFQHFVRERRDAALLLAGLPHNVSELLSDKTISFLRRAFQHRLDPIGDQDVETSMKKTIAAEGKMIEPNALRNAVKSTGGFPFLIQLIGYHLWEQSGQVKNITSAHVEMGISAAHEDMGRMIFDTTTRELSETDIRFLLAMAADGDDVSQMSNIASRMGVTADYVSQYRLRMIEQGLIVPIRRGEVAYAIPMLREYIEKMYGTDGDAL